MTLPARPRGIRTSPDGLTIAMLYTTFWLALTVADDGAIQHVQLLDPADVEGWTEWTPAPGRQDGDQG
jgi:hypothetical protein